MPEKTLATLDARLDAADKLAPGSGSLDLGLVGYGDFDSSFVGGRLGYAHRINKTMSAIAEGQVGALFSDGGWSGQWQAMTGLRWRF